MREFTRSASDGVAGVLESQSAPGALLDNAGQLFGFWAAWRVDGDRLVLPTSLERIAFFGPLPAPGTLVDCVVNLTHIDDKTVRADLELTVDGVVWCTIREWEDRRFTTDDHLFLMLRRPQHELLAERMPGGWVLVREGWVDTATRDVVMRRFLGRDERADYEGRNPNAQRRWLLGRVAAKDAVRAWLTDRGHRPIFPVELAVANDDHGRPSVTGPHSEDLRISIAHTAGIGVALVGEGVDVGIDVEPVEPRSAVVRGHRPHRGRGRPGRRRRRRPEPVPHHRVGGQGGGGQGGRHRPPGPAPGLRGHRRRHRRLRPRRPRRPPDAGPAHR